MRKFDATRRSINRYENLHRLAHLSWTTKSAKVNVLCACASFAMFLTSTDNKEVLGSGEIGRDLSSAGIAKAALCLNGIKTSWHTEINARLSCKALNSWGLNKESDWTTPAAPSRNSGRSRPYLSLWATLNFKFRPAMRPLKQRKHDPKLLLRTLSNQPSAPQFAFPSQPTIPTLRQLLIILLILIQQIKRRWLRPRTSTNPLRHRQAARAIRPHRITKHILKRLRPLHAIIQPLEPPQVLQEVQERGVRVGTVGSVHGAFVTD